MSWTSKAQIGTDLAATDTEVFSDAVTLKSDETAHVQVDCDFASTPTDDLEIRVYTTLDATSESWDTMTFADAITLVNTTDPGRVGLTVTGVYKFRIGVKASGSTDEHTVQVYYRTNGDYKDCLLDI